MSPYVFVPPRVWPGVLDGVPAEFADCLREPAFKMEDTTFCIWRRHDVREWQHGPIAWPEGADPDGSGELLSPLDGNPETYHAWAEEYHEREVTLEAVAAIYAHQPLTAELVAALNPEITLADLAEDLQEIAYPA
jgi:hypothetical protein